MRGQCSGCRQRWSGWRAAAYVGRTRGRTWGLRLTYPPPGVATPARSGRSVLPRILETKETTLSPEFAAVTRFARTALWGRSNYVSGYDASVPKPARGFPSYRWVQYHYGCTSVCQPDHCGRAVYICKINKPVRVILDGFVYSNVVHIPAVGRAGIITILY